MMKPCELAVFLISLYLQCFISVTSAESQSTIQNTSQADKSDNLSRFPQIPIKFKEVKTIQLGKANHTDEKSRNVTWNLTGVNMTGKPEDVSRFNYETLWNNGLLTLTLVRFEIQKQQLKTQLRQGSQRQTFYQDEPENFLENSFFTQSDIESVIPDFLRRRFKRRVFGRDTRTQIPQGEFRKVPFSAVVKISTGCTGTLISSIHVLTSAHCVHDSSKYIVSVKNVKVGFPKHNGKMRWAGVKNIKVPRGWTTDKDVSYDYAVLKLVHHHRRKYMVPGSIVLTRGSITTHFLGFHQDKPANSLWYSFCKARPLDHVIINRCDAMPGSSGAGVYLLSNIGSKTVRFIVGVLSGSGTVRFRKSNGRSRRFNIATKLTPLKAAQICAWIKSAPYCNALA
ncbi:serine protease 23-like [Actinia tenebrosa]|uniref:Serine protease 23-like n=1 Tax=Actinia tenebrosa TaxID=6105 RepID=A0A6P8HL75_ACTTE|nr:serine protease 23-like [Actinia tenebrosa]